MSVGRCRFMQRVSTIVADAAIVGDRPRAGGLQKNAKVGLDCAIARALGFGRCGYAN